MTRLSWKGIAASALVAGTLAGLGVAQAAGDPAKVIAYRQAVMKSLAANATGLFAILQGDVSYSKNLLGHAKALHEGSMMIVDAFPEGSGAGAETRAKPEIWTDWEKFAAAAKTLEDASAELVTAAEGGDMAAIGAAAGKVGDACGGCHKPFRVAQQ